MVNKEESFELSDEAPFYGSVIDLDEYVNTVKQGMEAIKNTDNIRLVVIETWLLVDFAVQNMLSVLWNLKEFSVEDNDFDLRDELLPQSFKNRLELLERILKIQRKLPEKPVPPDYGGKITGSYCFMKFLKRKHPDVLEKFNEVRNEYITEKYPEHKGVVCYTTPTTRQEKKYCANTDWVEALRAINKEWISQAKRLNGARNKAAHSCDSKKILSKLGLFGNNAEEKAREECLKMLRVLLGIFLRA